MKKTVLLLGCALLAFAGSGADFTEGGLGYNIISDVTKTVAVTDCTGAVGDVAIPAAVTFGDTGYTVTEIAPQAFTESKITSLTLPESIEKIGDSAFAKCASLKSVRYNAVNCANAGKNRELSAFAGCVALQSVIIGDEVTVIPPYIFSGLGALRSIAIPRKVVEIGNNAFANCTSVSQVYVDAENLGTSNEAFTGCTNPMSVVISDNVKSVPYRMFYGVSGVRSVTVGKSVEVFYQGCFASCNNLKSVTLNCEKRNVTTYWSLGTTVVAPFGSCDALTNVVIGDNVVEIPNGMFTFCSHLNTVTFGKSLEKIGEWAFYKTGLTSFKAPSTLKNINTGAFAATQISIVELNEGLEFLAGFGNTQVREVKIPSTVKTIGYEAFFECPLRVAEGLDGNSLVTILDKAFYRTQLSGPVKFGDSLKDICTEAFYDVTGITSVTFGSNLELIGKNAFSSTGLTGQLLIPTSVKRIEESAFRGTKISGTLVIPEQLEWLGRSAFSECINIEGLEYNAIAAGGSTDYYGSPIFKNAPLKSVSIGDKVKSFPSYTFADLPLLENVVLPQSLETLPYAAFQGCSSLKEINLPEGLKYMGEEAFNNCSSLTELVIPESLLYIDDLGDMSHLSRLVYNARECKGYFYTSTCPELKTVVLGPGVEKLKPEVFMGDKIKVVVWNAKSINEFLVANKNHTTGTAIIAENVETFGGYNFNTVISNAPVPPALTLPKAGTNAYVPDVEAYKNNADWSKYLLRQSVTWSGTIDGQSLKYEVNFPYPLSLKHYLDSEGNVMEGTPCELGHYKAVFTYMIGEEEYELISPLSIEANTSNTMRASETRVYAGRTGVIPVEMVNDRQITSFQFDLYLPEGVKLATDEYGDYVIELSDRKSNTHTITSKDIEGGKAVRIAAMSMRNQPFAGTDGIIVNLTVEVAGDAPLGDTFLSLRNIRLVEPSSAAEEFYTNRNDSPLGIGGIMEGDTNEDGKVTMADVVNTVNMMLGIQPDVFVFDAADLVADGKITVSDVVAVMNIAMNAASKVSHRQGRVNRVDDGDTAPTGGASADGYGLEVPQVTIPTDSEGVMSVDMVNEDNITAFQFDLYLPEGITIPEDEWGDPSILLGKRAHRTHILVTRYQPDGALRVAAYSTQNSPFKGNSGQLLDIDLKTAENVAPGQYNASFTFIELTNPDATPHYVPDFNAIINVGVAGVESVELGDAVFTVRGGTGEIIIIAPESSHVTVCNLSGATVSSMNVQSGVSHIALPAGFYIVNGKKVLVK